jgi:hypothetical protein
MSRTMKPSEILAASGEVVAVVLKHTSDFTEGVNILYGAKAAIAGGLKSGRFDWESPAHPDEVPLGSQVSG